MDNGVFLLIGIVVIGSILEINKGAFKSRRKIVILSGIWALSGTIVIASLSAT